MYNISLLLTYIFIKKINYYSFNIILIYLIIIYFNQIIKPIYYAMFYKNIQIYVPVKEISKDLYLFLSDRKCCNTFSYYLNKQSEKKKNNFFLSLFINILEFRLRCIIQDNFNKIKNKGEYIIQNFLSKNNENNEYFNGEFISKLRNNCTSFLERNICKMNMFDEILLISYNYLNDEFIKFKSSSHEYINLISEINYEIYLRCKFIQCGLITKE